MTEPSAQPYAPERQFERMEMASTTDEICTNEMDLTNPKSPPAVDTPYTDSTSLERTNPAPPTDEICTDRMELADSSAAELTELITDEVCADEKNLTTHTSLLAANATSNAPVEPDQPLLLAPPAKDEIASDENRVTGSKVESNSRPDIKWASEPSPKPYDSDAWLRQHRKFIKDKEAIQRIEKMIPSRYQNLPTKYDVRNFQWNAERLRCIITETRKRIRRKTDIYSSGFKIEGWSGGQRVHSFMVTKSRRNNNLVSFGNEFNLLCVLACQSEQRDHFQFKPIDFVLSEHPHPLYSESFCSALDNLEWDVLGEHRGFGDSFRSGMLLWNQCWGCKHSLILCPLRSMTDDMKTLLYHRIPPSPILPRKTDIISKDEWLERGAQFRVLAPDLTHWIEERLSQNALDSAEYGGPWYLDHADILRVIMVEKDGTDDDAWDIYMEVFCCSHLVVSRRISNDVSPSSIIDDLIAPLAFRGGSPLPIHFYVIGSSWPSLNANCVGTRYGELPEIVMNWTQLWNVPHVLHPKRSSASRAIWYSKPIETLESVSWTTALFGDD